jgi:hypothetical protein
MNGYEWHAQHSEQAWWINKRELLQISNPSQQNQRGCLLSTGPLCFLYFGPIVHRKQLVPQLGREALICGMTLRECADFCVGDGLDAFTAPGWHDEPAPAVVWCQDAMVAGEIDPRFRP